jgi:hypothetical protein
MINDVPRDRFGLPVPPSCPETANARLWRQAIARSDGELVLRELFYKLKINLGEVEARRLFDLCSKLKPKRRKHRGVSDPARDAKLLDTYDLFAEAESRGDASLPRRVAEHLHNQGVNFGSSVPAIEKHLRRLLSARNSEREREAKEKAEYELQLAALVSEYTKASEPDK